MNHAFELMLLFATASLMILPFIPTLSEWLRPTDNAPLPIDQQATHGLRHLADSMRGQMRQLFGESPTPEQMRLHDRSLHRDGLQITVLHTAGGRVDLRDEKVAEVAGSLGQIAVLPETAAIAPGGDTLADFYAMNDLQIGDDVKLRAGCILGNARLGKNVLVHRWIDAKTIVAGEDLKVHGRITAVYSIHFSHNSTFVRGGAPAMLFGEPVEGAPMPVYVDHPIATPEETRRFILEGDNTVGEEMERHGNFVVRGSARVDPYCHIAGSIKAYDHLRVGDGVNIAGAALATKSIVLGAGCAVMGPIISEEDIVIGPNCLIGSPGIPTTVICRKLVIGQGAVIHGVVTTQDSANVVFEEIPLAV